MSFRRLLPLALLAAPANAGAQQCLSASRSESVALELRRAEQAFADFENEKFTASIDAAALMLPCLDEAIAPSVAATYHRIHGIRLYVGGREDSAMGSLAAARALEPAYVLPESMFPKDHALRYRYERLPLVPEHTQRLPRPKRGWLTVDGQRARERAAGAAAIVQVIEPDGDVALTRYVGPEDPLPEYPAVHRNRNRLAAAAAGSAALAGGAFALSWVNYGKFNSNDPTYDLDRMHQLQSAANGWFAASIVLGATAAGAGAAAVAVGPR